eukprot:365038-Chlamydomonas_euryale.AAC.2
MSILPCACPSARVPLHRPSSIVAPPARRPARWAGRLPAKRPRRRPARRPARRPGSGWLGGRAGGGLAAGRDGNYRRASCSERLRLSSARFVGAFWALPRDAHVGWHEAGTWFSVREMPMWVGTRPGRGAQCVRCPCGLARGRDVVLMREMPMWVGTRPGRGAQCLRWAPQQQLGRQMTPQHACLPLSLSSLHTPPAGR